MHTRPLSESEWFVWTSSQALNLVRSRSALHAVSDRKAHASMKILTKESGTTTAIAGAGCCDAGVEQLVSISNAAAFPKANLKV
jgi:hypothetical protein